MVVPFSLPSSLSGARLELVQSYSKSLGVSITSLGGYAGTLALSTTSSPSGLDVTVNPTSISLAAGQTAGATIEVATTSETPAESYSASLNVSTGQAWQSVTFYIYVDGFTLGADLASLGLENGGSASTTVAVAGQGMFYGTEIALSVSGTLPQGLNAVLNPSYVHLNSPPYATTTLTISASSVPPGTYNVTVNATWQSLSHAINVTIRVFSVASVVRGMNNGIYYATLAGSWGGWQSLGGVTASAPVLCYGTSGSPYLVVRGWDNASIYINSYSNGVWFGWTSPGGTTNAQPACASMMGIL